MITTINFLARNFLKRIKKTGYEKEPPITLTQVNAEPRRFVGIRQGRRVFTLAPLPPKENIE